MQAIETHNSSTIASNLFCDKSLQQQISNHNMYKMRLINHGNAHRLNSKYPWLSIVTMPWQPVTIKLLWNLNAPPKCTSSTTTKALPPLHKPPPLQEKHPLHNILYYKNPAPLYEMCSLKLQASPPLILYIQ